MMGLQVDNAERTAARRENNMQNLDGLRLYTLTELEGVLNLTHRTLQTYIKDGRLKGVKIGNRWKVTEESLRDFLNAAPKN